MTQKERWAKRQELIDGMIDVAAYLRNLADAIDSLSPAGRRIEMEASPDQIHRLNALIRKFNALA